MKIFSLLFLLTSSIQLATAQSSGCFHEQEINVALEEELKQPCEKFPEIVDSRRLRIKVGKDFTLKGEVFKRLPSIEQLILYGDISIEKHHIVTITGEINLPKLKRLSIQRHIQKIDISQAVMIFKALEEVTIFYFDGFFDLMRTGAINPALITDLSLIVGQDFTLRESDFSQLKSLKELNILHDDDKTEEFVVTVEGTIDLPRLTSLVMDYGIKRVDASHGKFILKNLEILETLLFDGFFDLFKLGAITADTSLELSIEEGKEVHLDFKGFTLGQSLSIIGATTVSHLNLPETSNLVIKGQEGKICTVSQLSFAGSHIEMVDVDLELSAPLKLTEGELSLENVRVKGDLLSADSELRELSLTNTNITVPETVIVKDLSEVSLSSSIFRGLALPTTGKKIYHFHIINSEASIESLPNLPKAMSIVISGKVKVLDHSLPLVVHERIEYLLMSLPSMKTMSIDLKNPKKISSLYFVDQKESELKFLNVQNLIERRESYKMVVDTKVEALKLRKLFKTKSVAFREEKF